MKIAKIISSKKELFVEVVKTGSVKFDTRPGWVFVREIDKIFRKCEVFWVHPEEVKFVWIREFK